jgi:hypothetical protein
MVAYERRAGYQVVGRSSGGGKPLRHLLSEERIRLPCHLSIANPSIAPIRSLLLYYAPPWNHSRRQPVALTLGISIQADTYLPRQLTIRDDIIYTWWLRYGSVSFAWIPPKSPSSDTSLSVIVDNTHYLLVGKGRHLGRYERYQLTLMITAERLAPLTLVCKLLRNPIDQGYSW